MKLNIGSGFTKIEGFINVDKIKCIDDHGVQFTDVVCDIEKEKLPYPDNSIDEIGCFETLEHLENLIFAMNEMHRVLKPTGFLKGKVPKEYGHDAWADPTHKRIFNTDTFEYFTGINKHKKNRPKRPKHADYGIKPWYKITVDTKINFILRPRKTTAYDEKNEKL